MKLAALFILFICSAASADCSTVLAGWSAHFEAKNEYGEEWNQDHGAVGLSCRGYSVMRMTNSYGNDTVAVGHEWTLSELGRWSATAYLGAWTGYEKSVLAVPAVNVSYKVQRVGASVMLLPHAAAVFLTVRL